MSAWIATVPVAEATGQLRAAYQSQQDKIGHVTELTQLGSLYPDLVAARLRLYAVVDATPSRIPEWARHAIALLTSALNACLFCTAGHRQRLAEDGRGALAEAIVASPDTVSAGDPAVDALLDYTRLLAWRPGHVTAGHIARLREHGYDDLDILDVNNIAAYYSYINRVASGLGLHGEG